jgi:hypothetical protein
MTTGWQRLKRKIIRRGLLLLILGIPAAALPAELMNEFTVSNETAVWLADEAEWLWQQGKDHQAPENNP